MICEICKQREAVSFAQSIVSGVLTVHRLCEICINMQMEKFGIEAGRQCTFCGSRASVTITDHDGMDARNPALKLQSFCSSCLDYFKKEFEAIKVEDASKGDNDPAESRSSRAKARLRAWVKNREDPL